MGILPFDPLAVPLLNTVILLRSGVTVTWAHHMFMRGEDSEAGDGLIFTVRLGLLFTLVQALEYAEAPFSINDRVFGRVFFVGTGFHGIHVIVGTLFLLVSFSRLRAGQFSSKHHFGLEAAAWY